MQLRKKYLSALLAAAVCCCPIAASAMAKPPHPTANPCQHINLDWLNQHLDLPEAEILEKQPQHGLCQLIVQFRNKIVPVYAGQDFVIVGDMFTDKTPVVKATIEHYRKQALIKAIADLQEVVAIKYVPENGNGKNVYMLTDPLCSYCNTAMQQLAAVAEETGVTFNLVLHNVHGEQGDAKIREAICHGMDFKQYSDSEWKKESIPEGSCAKADHLIEKTAAMAAKLGVRSVPLFLLEDGQVVSGNAIDALKTAITKLNARKIPS